MHDYSPGSETQTTQFDEGAYSPFGVGAEGCSDQESLEEWNKKLVFATTHKGRAQALKSCISSDFREHIKHLAKLQDALADAIRLKSTVPLFQAFGDEWEKNLDELTALDRWHDSMRHWRDEEGDR